MFARRLAELLGRDWITDARPLGMPIEQLIDAANAAARGVAEVAEKLNGLNLDALERAAAMFFTEEQREAVGQVVGAALQLRNAARRARELEDAGRPITD